MPSTMPVSRLPKYSPLCCLYSSKKVFCTATVSVGREREQAIAYFSVSASSWSRGTTLLTKPQSYISLALNGLPVKSISENFRRPMVSAHHQSRGPQPTSVSYTHLRAHETGRNLVCRLLLETKKTT